MSLNLLNEQMNNFLDGLFDEKNESNAIKLIVQYAEQNKDYYKEILTTIYQRFQKENHLANKLKIMNLMHGFYSKSKCGLTNEAKAITIEFLTNIMNIYFDTLFKDNEKPVVISLISQFAEKNKEYIKEISKLIYQRYLKESIYVNKVKIINVIHSISKGKYSRQYVDEFKSFIFEIFSECYNNVNQENKIHLFKLYYTWKYLIPNEILEKLRIKFNFDEMKEEIKRTNPQLIEKYDNYNNMKLEASLKNQSYSNNGSRLKSLISSNKKFGEDDENNKNPNNNYKTNQSKKSPHLTLNNQMNQMQNPHNNLNPINTSLINNNSSRINNTNNNNNNNKEREKQMRIKKIQKEINKKQYLNKKRTSSPKSTHSTTSNRSNDSYKINKNSSLTQSIKPQTIINPFYPTSSHNQLFPQIINKFPNILQKKPEREYLQEKILYVKDSRIELNYNFSFFSSLAKFFHETYQTSGLLPSTEIGNVLFEKFNNENEYKKIKDYSKNILFDYPKKNECCICGYRNLFYDKFVQHLDIHYHYNYLKTTSFDKLLTRRPGCSKNNWITNNYNLIFKNKNNYTLNALLYYHIDNDRTSNNQNNNENEKEDDNEELIYHVGKNEIKCYYCGDELKKKFFPKYHYWFYVNVFQIKNKGDMNNGVILIHEHCFDDFKLLQKVNL
jgi:hypothetical protein